MPKLADRFIIREEFIYRLFDLAKVYYISMDIIIWIIDRADLYVKLGGRYSIYLVAVLTSLSYKIREDIDYISYYELVEWINRYYFEDFYRNYSLSSMLTFNTDENIDILSENIISMKCDLTNVKLLVQKEIEVLTKLNYSLNITTFFDKWIFFLHKLGYNCMINGYYLLDSRSELILLRICLHKEIMYMHPLLLFGIFIKLLKKEASSINLVNKKYIPHLKKIIFYRKLGCERITGDTSPILTSPLS